MSSPRALIGVMALVMVTALGASTPSAAAGSGSYVNPLNVRIPGDGRVESCADPSLIRQHGAGVQPWYMFCTTDPLNAQDRNSSGGFNFHLIPTLKSWDLVNWTYVGDVFSARPSWVAATAGLWAPDIEYLNGQYHLYYTASDTSLPGGGSAIGVATAPTPAGPWADSGVPVVEPHAAPCCPGSRRWVFDPDFIQFGGQNWLYYGSYFGGVSVRKLDASGLHSDPSSQQPITVGNRYEGTEVVQHEGHLYLMASATNCCNGALTGYAVFTGRSDSPTGPFLDREGNSLLQGRVGGTPAIVQNGNRWVGTGHNEVFTDMAGRDWTVFHGVDRNNPYFAGAPGFTKRPVLLDALDWIGGWPVVNAGAGPSDTPERAPAAQPGEKSKPSVNPPASDSPGRQVRSLSTEFDGAAVPANWTWVRQPAPAGYGVEAGSFRFNTQAADLYKDSNNASVLTEPAPNGDYLVETKVSLDVPSEGCCFNYVQAGLVIYQVDDHFIKLTQTSIWETRQTEFAKETTEEPRYGNTVVGPPADWTWLRIVKRVRDGVEYYRAYTSQDGVHWARGGVWTHRLGSQARIGLVSMGGSGFVARFDYVRVFRLAAEDDSQ